ncbi:hypothetical protein P280DRAFT_478961 [Massarina eburnea CBS 473.64]|uniref:AA1-like domain-containing protein n=1 Tax=Massarina eburnea CBS 473.64 TaxID=1395130 RepID=A0A6A6S3G5_9PLEO|nr:hypothetical protein P280DRAFT_478961 [Massarina eburnea CBS 473.64]
MYIPFLLFHLLPFTLALSATPGPATFPSSPTWTLSKFYALTTPTESSASFIFQDHGPLSSNIITLECEVGNPIYRNTFTACGPGLDLLFKLSEGDVILRRTYRLPNGRRVTGIAAQSTYWTEANRTSGDDWDQYTRTEDWYFPVATIIG